MGPRRRAQLSAASLNEPNTAAARALRSPGGRCRLAEAARGGTPPDTEALRLHLSSTPRPPGPPAPGMRTNRPGRKVRGPAPASPAAPRAGLLRRPGHLSRVRRLRLEEAEGGGGTLRGRSGMKPPPFRDPFHLKLRWEGKGRCKGGGRTGLLRTPAASDLKGTAARRFRSEWAGERAEGWRG